MSSIRLFVVLGAPPEISSDVAGRIQDHGCPAALDLGSGLAPPSV